MIEIDPQAALEGWDTQRKLVDALGHLGRVRDADVQIGTTPKDEVLRIDKTILYRYRPMVEKPAPVPILLSYALVGRYTMMDLQEDRSLVRNLLRAGLDVYVVDWGHPSRADRFAGPRRLCERLSGRLRRRDVPAPRGPRPSTCWASARAACSACATRRSIRPGSAT